MFLGTKLLTLIDNIQKHIFHYVWRIIREIFGIIFDDFSNPMKQPKKSMMMHRK